MVENVVVTLRQKIAEKEQTLAVNVDPAATAVVGDRDKLVQVLTNYVSNAHKYTQAGGAIRVEVTVEGSFARVAVIDNGHGIAPDDQARLFTRFYRVDNELTREVGGTGLGLSIVKQLVELQGGATGVTSALGAGSTFWFTVPLAATAAAAPAEPAASTPAVAAPSSPPTTILVVEDDPDVARLIASHLQKAGYRVRVAHTAEDALAGLADDLPDLITLDLAGERLLARLDLRNIHFADLVNTFFDYAIIARYFRHPQVAELEQVSGARQKFFVIPMSSGNRKLLMYDLIARIVDADSLPINIVVVSTWARTGWNVIAPNVLIDATATRDVTAWQQLRGRAILRGAPGPTTATG